MLLCKAGVGKYKLTIWLHVYALLATMQCGSALQNQNCKPAWQYIQTKSVGHNIKNFKHALKSSCDPSVIPPLDTLRHASLQVARCLQSSLELGLELGIH